MAKSIKGKIIKLILVLLLLTGTAAAAFIAYRMLKSEVRPTHTFTQMTPRPETLSFVFDHWPPAYNAMVTLDTEMEQISAEIDRLEKMETSFPEQRKIIVSEKSIWERHQKKLKSIAEKLVKSVEDIYVTYSVNKEKGLGLLEEKQEPILLPVTNALSEIAPLTQRLKSEPKGTFDTLLDRIKNTL